MRAVVLCTTEQQQAILNKATNQGVDFIFCINDFHLFQNTLGDVFFDLQDETSNTYTSTKKGLLIINAVSKTTKYLPEHAVRINAWDGFLEQDILELAAPLQLQQEVQNMMDKIGWQCRFAPDEIGMIAPRIIAMIINEAYFGLEDGISTKQEIDTAMKLGTNYPFGPFEWADKIGKSKILKLLNQLSCYDKRYMPCKLLKQEAIDTLTT